MNLLNCKRLRIDMFGNFQLSSASSTLPAIVVGMGRSSGHLGVFQFLAVRTSCLFRLVACYRARCLCAPFSCKCLQTSDYCETSGCGVFGAVTHTHTHTRLHARTHAPRYKIPSKLHFALISLSFEAEAITVIRQPNPINAPPNSLGP